MEKNDIERVTESYKRCLENPRFFDNFYAKFTSMGNEIRERFEKTDMKRQMEALKHGLQYMIMFASGSKIALAKIEDLGATHDRKHRNITPELYEAWLVSLIETVKITDPQYNDDLGMEWRNVMSHGMRRMKAMY